MTTLAAGSSVSLAISNNGFLEVSTNGGLGSVTITPTNGAAVTESWGPGVFRKRWNGPYPDGAAVVLSNTSSAVFDYETDGSNLPAALQALATGAGIATPAWIVAAYEAQQADDAIRGPLMIARTGLPVAADQPTITASATAPASDADAASQVIYPFGTGTGTNYGSTDPIPPSALRKTWIRGFSPLIRAYGADGSTQRLSSALAKYATDETSAQGLDTSLNYGIQQGMPEADLMLDGDVLFLRLAGGAANSFELFVNGALYTTVSTGMATASAGRYLYPSSAGYVKIKFGTVTRRRLTFRFPNQRTPGSFHLRATHTLTPFSGYSPVWGHLGDSFSFGSGAASGRGYSCAEWMRLAFGFGVDFINTAYGGGSLAGNGGAPVNKPGDTPVSGQRASLRTQYELVLKGLPRLDILTILSGQNELAANAATITSEVTALLQSVAADHPECYVFVIGANAAPATITSGDALAAENAMAAGVLAANNPKAKMIRLQGGDQGPFLRGTGRSGATTGAGNSDIYTGGTDGTDATHPTDTGHQAYGQRMARGVYEAALSF